MELIQNNFLRDFFEYDDYRLLIKYIIQERKMHNKTCSYRWLSNGLGLTSPNFIQLVVLGKRSLSFELSEKLISLLKLSSKQSSYFRLLIQFQKAKTLEEKMHFADMLYKFKRADNIKSNISDKGVYFRKWFNIVIREIFTLKKVPKNVIAISQLLDPAISPIDAEKSIEELKRIGLLKLNSNNELEVVDINLSTGDKISNAFLTQFHFHMIEFAKKALETKTANERYISCLTTKLSKQSYNKVIEKITELKQEILRLSEVDIDADQIFQINFQTFPITKKWSQD
jgi:uncharacterized protein (TIGR02147 family)